jgi:very-short-patch-repair endonuclease
MPDDRLHVAVAPNASRLRCPDDVGRAWDPEDHPDIVLHWNRYPWPEVSGSPVVSLHTALANVIRAMPHDAAMTSVDSALNFRLDKRPIFTRADLGRVIAELPRKHSRVATDADGRAQSGLETLARLRLKRLGIRVRIQVRVKGVGHVDVLIGDRLVLELDSREHHLGKQYHEDRRRDLELIAQGFLVLRVSYERVMFDWDSIERVILAVVRRDDHLRTASRRRRGLASTLR